MTNPTPERIAEVAAGLSEAWKDALLAFPDLCDANPARRRAAVTFGSLWRKLTRHRASFEALEQIGVVERRVSRGETLWRPTKPLGLAVRNRLAHSAAPDSELVEEVAKVLCRSRGGEDCFGLCGGCLNDAETITSLILRARDAEIVSWLRQGCPIGRDFLAVPMEQCTLLANAIEAGEVGRG